MRSDETTVRTAPPVASVSASACLASTSSAVTEMRSRAGSKLISESTTFTTCASGESPGSASTITERASSGLAMARSRGSAGSPVRQTRRVGLPFGSRSRSASSMTTLSSRAMTTTHASRWFSLATPSSARIAGSVGAQPRTSTWLRSTTRERPLRSSVRRWSRAVAIRPISAETRKMPARVMAIEISRIVHVESPVKVPASIARPSESHSCSATPPSASTPLQPVEDGADDHQEERGEPEVRDEGDRAGRHRLVEAVGEARAEGGASAGSGHGGVYRPIRPRG